MSDEVVVLAGGWSVSQFPGFRDKLGRLRSRYEFMAVNDSAYHMPPHVMVSMDRVWSEHRYPMMMDRLVSMKVTWPVMWFREGIFRNIPAPTGPHVRYFRCDISADAPLSHTVGWLNGGNSGICALNLALQGKPKRVFMLGFDMQRGPQGQHHWYDCSWTAHKSSAKALDNWSKRFEGINLQFSREGIELVNVTNYSAIPDSVVTRWEPEKFLASL
jgi:hypothetical protein